MGQQKTLVAVPVAGSRVCSGGYRATDLRVLRNSNFILTVGTRKMETLKDRYEIYVASMEGSTSYIKTFDEWLNS